MMQIGTPVHENLRDPSKSSVRKQHISKDNLEILNINREQHLHKDKNTLQSL